MCTNETIRKKVKALKELRAQRAELDEKITDLEDWIKKEMTEQDTYEFEGKDWKVTWNTVTSNKFNQSLFKTSHPEMYEQYKTLSESRRFNIY